MDVVSIGAKALNEEAGLMSVPLSAGYPRGSSYQLVDENIEYLKASFFCFPAVADLLFIQKGYNTPDLK